MGNHSAGRLPPSSLDAERAVASTTLLVPEAFDEVSRIVRAEDFYFGQIGTIWGAIEALHGANKPYDIAMVATWLRDAGKLDAVGGTPFLAELCDATPAIANVEHHARIVREKAKLRALTRLGSELASAAYEATDADQLTQDFLARIEGVSAQELDESLHFMGDIAVVELKEFHERRKNPKDAVFGIPTGLREVDARLGGMKRKAHYVVAGRPGNGKTGFLTAVGLNVAAMGFAAVIFSIEMPKEPLTQRALAQLAHVDIAEIEAGRMNPDDVAALTSATEKLKRLPIMIDDADQTLRSMRSTIRRALARIRKRFPNIQLGFVGIDYLQIIDAMGDEKSREQAVSNFARGCTKLAKEFNCPVMSLSQLNRAVELRQDKRPQLADLRESGSIEQEAFAVLMLYRHDYYREPGEKLDGLGEVIVRKVRQGGKVGTAHCAFHGPSAKWMNVHQTDFEPDYGLPI